MSRPPRPAGGIGSGGAGRGGRRPPSLTAVPGSAATRYGPCVTATSETEPGRAGRALRLVAINREISDNDCLLHSDQKFLGRRVRGGVGSGEGPLALGCRRRLGGRWRRGRQNAPRTPLHSLHRAAELPGSAAPARVAAAPSPERWPPRRGPDPAGHWVIRKRLHRVVHAPGSFCFPLVFIAVLLWFPLFIIFPFFSPRGK